MRVLITGAAGFIGSHLDRHLVEHGHETCATDMAFATMTGRACDPDLTIPGAFSAVVHAAEPDLVVHLAAQVGRLFGEDNLINAIQSNAQMTTLVASACGQANIPLVYASTSEVYGDRGAHICTEHDPLDVLPHNLYGLSKRWGEEACQLYAPNDLKIVRLSMPYGPGVPPGRGRRALDTMLWQALTGQPITVHRGAERSWCWIGDTVAGIRMVIEHGQAGAWNIGRDDAPVSMEAIAEHACAMTGAPTDLIQLIDPPAMQTVVKRLSTDKLRGLGWAPTVDLHEGMGHVLDWVREWVARHSGELAA